MTFMAHTTPAVGTLQSGAERAGGYRAARARRPSEQPGMGHRSARFAADHLVRGRYRGRQLGDHLILTNQRFEAAHGRTSTSARRAASSEVGTGGNIVFNGAVTTEKIWSGV